MLCFHVLVQGNQSAAGLSVTFDEAFSKLSDLPRMFIEPDGAFVWCGTIAAEGRDWQVDGNLIDRGDRLACVELRGCCPCEQLEKLLRALGWPEASLMFQLPRQGVLVNEREFRIQAASEAGAQ